MPVYIRYIGAMDRGLVPTRAFRAQGCQNIRSNCFFTFVTVLPQRGSRPTLSLWLVTLLDLCVLQIMALAVNLEYICFVG